MSASLKWRAIAVAVFCCLQMMESHAQETQESSGSASLLAQQESPATSEIATQGIDTPLAQSTRVESNDLPDPGPFRMERRFFQNIAMDQKRFWTSPFRLNSEGRIWLLPAAGVTAGLIYKDPDLARDFQVRPSRAKLSRQISDGGLAFAAGAVGGSYLWGAITKNDRLRETGWLAGEAMTNSLIAGSALSYTLGRQKPFAGGGNGDFFSGGDSFPSTHSMLAWSAASVFAHEYPGPLTQILAYGVASTVSLGRITGQRHFPSDVVIGSALGWAIGRQVYRARHNPELGGINIGRIVRDGSENRVLASTYVPIDSWLYSAMERATALGYAKSALSSTRPWTRAEFQRLTEEIGEELFEAGELANPEIEKLHALLRKEFADEASFVSGGSPRSFALDSVYMRVTAIAGTPLRDSIHFGQTIVNDFGRPYGEGGNVYTGFSGRAASGRFSLFVRAEYQHAAQGPVPSPSARSAIALSDSVQSGEDPNLFLQPAIPFPSRDRVQLLEAYGSVALRKWIISVGSQSLWWGPAKSPMLLSNNAEPILMVRVTNKAPFKLPSILGLMGPIRTEYFFGRVRGHRLVSPEFREPALPTKQPFIQGQKISFKPTPNLEFGVASTVLFGGNRFPLTTRSFLRSLFSRTNQTGPNDPGDRRAGFDFSYRVPGLRQWLLLYSDALADDEISPLGYPRRSAFTPGIYVPQLPKLSKLDFRAEAAYTDLPGLRDVGFFYFNQRYRSGYTSNDNLIGSTIGRQGRGIQVASTYWLTPENKFSMSYKAINADKLFLGGGSQRALGLQGSYVFRENYFMESQFQYQRWNYPVLHPTGVSNVTLSFQFTYRPKK